MLRCEIYKALLLHFQCSYNTRMVQNLIVKDLLSKLFIVFIVQYSYTYCSAHDKTKNVVKEIVKTWSVSAWNIIWGKKEG